MSDHPLQRTPSQRIVCILFWLLFMAWTYALEMPVVESVTSLLGGFWSFVLAKSLHLGVFATIMMLGLYWPVTIRGRWAIMALLSFHAAATELFQYLLNAYCHRHGCVQDVLIDHAGLTIGAAIYFGVTYLAKTRRNGIGEKAECLGPV